MIWSGCDVDATATSPSYALRIATVKEHTPTWSLSHGSDASGIVLGAVNAYAPFSNSSGWKYVTHTSTTSSAATFGTVMQKTSGCSGACSVVFLPKDFPLKFVVSSRGTIALVTHFFDDRAVIPVTVRPFASGIANRHEPDAFPFRSAFGTVHRDVHVTNPVERWHSTSKRMESHTAAL